MTEFDRKKLYPELYQTDEQVAKAMEKYGVILPSVADLNGEISTRRRMAGMMVGKRRRSVLEGSPTALSGQTPALDDRLPSSKRLSRGGSFSDSTFVLLHDNLLSESAERGPASPMGGSAATGTPTAKSTMVTRQQAVAADIYGQIPAQEPKEGLHCPNCQRAVPSTLRFASHLDKCMGIGTLSRAAAANSNNTNSNWAMGTGTASGLPLSVSSGTRSSSIITAGSSNGGTFSATGASK